MECFRIDESGYTGFDLLQEEQPFQGASAVAISDEDASRLIREHFPNFQSQELKYRSVAGRPANRERLIGLHRDVLNNYKCVTYICGKRYLLSLMFIDDAVEPFYYEKGINLYNDGANYAMASMFHLVGPTLFGKSGFDGLLRAFQQAVRGKAYDDVRNLVQTVQRLAWKEMPEVLGPLANAAPECLSAITNPGVTTDAALIVLQSLISRMEVMADGEYRVEHDQSKNLLQYGELLQRFVCHDQEIEFRQTEITSIKFPLKLCSVTQVNSKSSPAVQIADILIGAAIDSTKSLVGLPNRWGKNPLDIFRFYNDDQLIYLMPSLDFESQKRFRAGNQSNEMIDYFSKNFYEKNN